MLVQLIGYEFYKKWKTLRYILGGYIILQALLLMITRIFLGNDATKLIMEIWNNGQNGSFALGLISALYVIFAVGLFFLPLIENVYRFEKDLSGKQAVLELMLPVISWKKILSKLIVTLSTTIVCQMIAAISIITYILVNSNFNQIILDSIRNYTKGILSSPAKNFIVALYLLFILASLYMLVMFCIAFSKSISHKNRIAVPIGIGMFIACFAVLIVVGIQTEKYPIVEFDMFGIKQSLSGIISDIIAFVLFFLGASYLMEKRIEN